MERSILWMRIEGSFDIGVGWGQVVKSSVYQTIEFSCDSVDSEVC